MVIPVLDQIINEEFKQSSRPHAVLISNHGMMAPEIVTTTDTGGQSFYVNFMAKALVNLGYKVTVINRGGYTHLAVPEQMQKGIQNYEQE